MMRKMLAATLALGLAAGGASAQVSDGEAKARKEAERARAQAESARAELKRMAEELRATQRKLETFERELRTKERADEKASGAGERARVELRRALTEELRAKEAAGAKKEAYIGVVTAKAPELLAEHLGLKDGALVVEQVTKESPADKSGIKSHDILLSFNGKSITSPEQLKKLVVGEKPGGKVAIVVLRGGRKQELGVVLGERDATSIGGLFGAAEGNKFKVGEGDFKVFGRMGEGADVARQAAEEARKASADARARGAEARAEARKKAEAGDRAPEGPRVRSRVDVRPRIGGAAGGGGGDGSSSTINITINSTDGRITINGSVTRDGKTESFSESGTKEELLKKVDKFPEKVRDSIRHSLEGMERGPGGKGARIRIENRASADAKDGDRPRVTVRALDAKTVEDLKAKGADLAKLHEKLAAKGADMAKLHEHLKAHVLDGDKLKELHAKIQVLDAETGKLKALESLGPDVMKKVEGKLEGLKALKLEELHGLDKLKDLEALKDLDVQVRVLAPEHLKDLKDLKDKLPKEIEVEVRKALEDAGLKDKLKEKRVIIDRRDSQ